MALHHVAAALACRGEAEGRCIGPTPRNNTCPASAVPTVAGRCRACQDAFNAYRGRVYRERKEAHLCTNCGEGDVHTRQGLALCYACREARQRYASTKRAQSREDALFALLGRLRGRRQAWAFWVLRQLGWTIDERSYLTLGPAEPVREPLEMADAEEVQRRIEAYGREHPLTRVYETASISTRPDAWHHAGATTGRWQGGMRPRELEYALAVNPVVRVHR